MSELPLNADGGRMSVNYDGGTCFRHVDTMDEMNDVEEARIARPSRVP